MHLRGRRIGYRVYSGSFWTILAFCPTPDLQKECIMIQVLSSHEVIGWIIRYAVEGVLLQCAYYEVHRLMALLR